MTPNLARSGIPLAACIFSVHKILLRELYSFFDFDLTFFSLPLPKVRRETITPRKKPAIIPITRRTAAAFFLKLTMCSKSVNKYCRCSLSFANLLNFFRRSFTIVSYIEGTGGIVSCKADLYPSVTKSYSASISRAPLYENIFLSAKYLRDGYPLTLKRLQTSFSFVQSTFAMMTSLASDS